MMRGYTTVPVAAFAMVFAHALAQPAQAVPTFVAHGIDGDDYGLSPELPVDISVDGKCALKGVEFGQVAETDLAVGPHEIKLSLSNGSCGGDLVATGRIDVSLLSTVIVIAHIDVNFAPKISQFTTDASAASEGLVRATAYHTAAAPGVDVRIKRGGKIAKNLQNGEQSFPAEVKTGDSVIRVSASGKGSPILEVPVTFEEGFAYAAFAVGSVANETLTVIPVVIETPLPEGEVGEDAGETEEE